MHAPAALIGHGCPRAAEMQAYFSGSIRAAVMQPSTIHTPRGLIETARYGALGHLAALTPIVLFDHPAMVQNCGTAFTSGTCTFINAYFARQLLEEDSREESGGSNALLFYLHELSHILYGHTDGRLDARLSRLERNYVFDAVVNPRNLRSFPWLRPGPITRSWVGMSPEAVHVFGSMSEEQAADFFQEDRAEFNRIATGKREDPAWLQDSSDRGHFGDGTELSRWLEGCGLGSALERLAQPGSEDRKGQDAVRRRTRDQVHSVAIAVRSEITRARAAGADLSLSSADQACVDYVRLGPAVARDWKLQFGRSIRRSMEKRWHLSDDSPHPVRHVSPETMGLTSAPYLPGLSPKSSPRYRIIAIADSSGSMKPAQIKAVLQEAVSIVQSGGGQADLILHWADSVLRGKPVQITRETLADGLLLRDVEVIGRGSTDFTACLVEVSKLYAQDIRRQSIAAIVYFTDLKGRMPEPTELPRTLPRVVFVTHGEADENLQKSIRPWADVIELRGAAPAALGDRR